MPPWRLRDFHDDDLDQAISVWDQSRCPGEASPVFPISEVVSAARSGQPAIVAVVGDELVGIAVAQFQAERAWVSMVGLSNRWRNRGIGSALLAELELRLRSLGVRRIGALLPAEATGTAALRNSGYHERTELVYFEKVDPLGASDAGLLAELGGQPMPRGLWHALAGMEKEKQVIERRIVLPLTEPNVAEQYGVSPPKAVILFGPRGPAKPPSPRPLRVGSVGRSSSCSRRGWRHPTWPWQARCGKPLRR
ncbi:acetyltransferase family protein [Mycobacterium xenopi 3993]|nr:acetyltransferase family protein [Mycobacterium xenopi 3993]